MQVVVTNLSGSTLSLNAFGLRLAPGATQTVTQLTNWRQSDVTELKNQVALGRISMYVKHDSTLSHDLDYAASSAATKWATVRLPVVAAASTNITLSGLQTVDGVALNAGDRVLVYGQTTASQNGIYLAASGAWTRAGDCNVGGVNVFTSMLVPVAQGTTHGTHAFQLTTTGTIVVGTTSLTFAQAY